jgi:hypothetical protein
MKEKRMYSVNNGQGKIVLCSNLKQTHKIAETINGTIRYMPYWLYKDGSSLYGWDWPTFKIQSTELV